MTSEETGQADARDWLPSTLAIEFSDGDTRVIRTTTQPVRSIKAQRPRTATHNS